jgi:hypothetical protein
MMRRQHFELLAGSYRADRRVKYEARFSISEAGCPARMYRADLMRIEGKSTYCATFCRDTILAMATESYSRRAEKADRVKTGTEVDISEKPGLDDIAKNDEQSRQFGLYLQSTGDSAASLAFRHLEKGKPTEADEAVFERHLEEFNKRQDRFEKVHKAVSAFRDDLLTHSPIFKKFRDQKGGENIARVFSEGLRDMALKEPTAFARVETEVQRLVDVQDREAAQDKRISEWCSKNKIVDDDKFLDTLKITDERQRHAKIREMLRGGMDWKKKMWDSVFRGTSRQAKGVSSENLAAQTQLRERVSQQAGDYFKGLMVQNKEIREALARMHTEAEPAFEKGAAAQPSLSEARAGLHELDEDKVIERAKAFRKANAAEWRNPAKRAALIDTFHDEEETRYNEFKKKPGFFARLLAKFAKKFDTRTDAKITAAFA